LAVAVAQFNGGGNNGGNNGGGFGGNGGGWGHYHLGYGFVAQGGKGHEQHAVAKVHVQQTPHDYHYSVSYIIVCNLDAFNLLVKFVLQNDFIIT